MEGIIILLNIKNPQNNLSKYHYIDKFFFEIYDIKNKFPFNDFNYW